MTSTKTRRHHRGRKRRQRLTPQERRRLTAALAYCQDRLGFQASRDAIGHFAKLLGRIKIDRSISISHVFARLGELEAALTHLLAPTDPLADIVSCRSILGEAIGETRACRHHRAERKIRIAFSLLSRAQGAAQRYVFTHSRMSGGEIVVATGGGSPDGRSRVSDNGRRRVSDNGRRPH